MIEPVKSHKSSTDQFKAQESEAAARAKIQTAQDSQIRLNAAWFNAASTSTNGITATSAPGVVEAKNATPQITSATSDASTTVTSEGVARKEIPENLRDYPRHIQAYLLLQTNRTPSVTLASNSGMDQTSQKEITTENATAQPKTVTDKAANEIKGSQVDPQSDRSRKISDWLANRADTSGMWQRSNWAANIHDALNGKSELGALTESEQRYLVDQALASDKKRGPLDLADAVKNDPGVRGVVAESMAAKAINLMQQPKVNNAGYDNPHARATIYALDAIRATGGDNKLLGQIVGKFSSEDGVRFTRALSESGPISRNPRVKARNQLLEAVNTQPQSQTVSAIAQTVFAATSVSDLKNVPELKHNLAVAMAREIWPDAKPDTTNTLLHQAAVRTVAPDNTAVRTATAQRLEAILDTREGRMVLMTGPTDQRVTAMYAVGRDETLTAHAIKQMGEDPIKSPVINRAMADVLVPKGVDNRQAELERITGLLGTSQGRAVMFGNEAEKYVTPELRMQVRQIVLSDRSITADKLKDADDPYASPAIAIPLAQLQSATYRNDVPTQYTGTGLENMIGTAMNMPVTLPEGMSFEEAAEKARKGEFSFYGDENVKASVEKVAAQIREVGGNNPQVTALPVTFWNRDTGLVKLPLFRVATANGDKFVDNIGRSYENIADWKANNKLPEGQITFPTDGKLKTDKNGALQLESFEKKQSTTEKILDWGMLIGGTLATGAVIIGTGGTAALVMGGAAMLYGTYRTGSDLYDRSQHGQSIDPIHDSEARSLWLEFGANVSGMGAFAGEARLASLLKNSGVLRPVEAGVIGTMRVSATVTDGIAFTNAGVDLARNWSSMNGEQKATALLQMSFWGTTSAMGARQARSFNEMLNPVAATKGLLNGFNPTIIRTDKLPGNGAELQPNLATGQWTLRVGMQATDADVALHVRQARLTMMDRGLQGWIREGFGAPKEGSAGWIVKNEAEKIHAKIRQLQKELANSNTPQQRTQIEADIKATEKHMLEVYDKAEAMAAHPESIIIAAPSEGSKHAERFSGLTEALENGPHTDRGYYFRVDAKNPEGPPQIIRKDGYDADHVRLEAYEKSDGKWGIRASSEDPKKSQEDWRKEIAADYKTAKDPETVTKTTEALDKANASDFVRGYVNMHEKAFALLEQKGVDVKKIVTDISGRGDASAADTLRQSLRDEAIKLIKPNKNTSPDMALLNDFMLALPTNGERGALFTAFREMHMPDGISHVARVPNDTGIEGTTRKADGVVDGMVEINGHDVEGRFLAEDKSGDNAFDLQQAKRYNEALKGGKITTKAGDPCDGVMYFFQNKDAAKSAAESMKREKISGQIHVGYYKTDGTFKWVR